MNRIECRFPCYRPSRFVWLVLLVLAQIVSGIGGTAVPIDRWRALGPYGGTIFSLEFHRGSNEIAFAASANSVYKTANGGQLWERLPLGKCLIRIHPRQPQAVLAVCTSGVYLSNDAGTTWTFESELPFGSDFDAEFYPSNPSIIYLVMDNASPQAGGAFYKSLNAGRTWKLSTRGLAEYQIRAEVEVDPDNGEHLCVLADFGLFVSTNGGNSWNFLQSSQSDFYPGYPEQLRIPILKLDPANPRTLYLAEEGGLLKTLDGGQHWSTLRKTNSGSGSISLDPAKPGRLLYAENDSLYQTENGGETWSQIPTPHLYQENSIDMAAIDPNHSSRILLSTPPQGLLTSVNRGRSWHPAFNGISGFSPSIVETAATQPPRLLVPIDTRGDRLAQSINNGASWRVFRNLRYEYALAVHPRSPSVWAAQASGGVAVTQNSGNSWAIHPLPENAFAYDLEFDPFDPRTLYAGTNGAGVQKSTDSGETWSRVNSGLTDPTVRIVRADPSRQNVLFAALQNRKLVRTVNGGGNWTEVASSGCGNNEISDVQINPVDTNEVFYATTRFDIGRNCNHLFRSRDGGGSFQAVDQPLTFTGFERLYFEPGRPGTIYLAAEGGGLYVTGDRGTTWSLFDMKGLITGSVFGLSFSPVTPGLMFGANGLGVFSFQRASPSGMSITQMAPNPARPGSEMRLLGDGFGTGGELWIGPNRLSPASWSDTEIRFVLPPDSRTASVKVTHAGASVAQELLVMNGVVYPSSGPAAGGTRVLIRMHRNLFFFNQVLFGRKVAPVSHPMSLHFQYAADGSTLILCTTPPGTGTVSVYVKGESSLQRVGNFRYE